MQKSPEKTQTTENENKAILKKYFSGHDRHYSTWGTGKGKGDKEQE